MRKIFLLLSLFATSLAGAQKIADPKPFAAGITEEDLKKHLYTVASKDFEGRETATEGQRKAAAYIENHFRSLGLLPGNKDSYQLFFPVFQDSTGEMALTINGQSFRPSEDFVANPGYNYSATLFGGEIVFAGYGISDSTRDDYKGLDVKGKIVLILNGEPADPSRPQGGAPAHFSPFGKQEAAQKNGAIALMVIQSGFPRKNYGPKGNMYLNGFKNRIFPNTFYISDRVAGAILGEDFDKATKDGAANPAPYKADIMIRYEKITLQLHSSDVLGFLEGSDLKDQLVVISAHYDHLGKRDSVIYYGADDDGSGTVSVLELATAFAKAKAAGSGPRRSILFLANSGEEKGLWGSEYYSDHPVFDLAKTTVDLNIDMVGRIDPNRKHGDSANYVYIVGDDKLSSDLHPISVEQNKKYTKLELDYKFNDPKDPERIYYRSDHYNFARKGVPIIFYFDGIHHDYHKPTDTPDKINYDLLAKRDRLIFYTAWEMANRDEMLKRDRKL
ncbi:MAG: M28 family peptidase [Puia sp.]|nr:M28 family peptidase [Puia sp.]